MSELLKGLNPAQKEVVVTVDGPLLVLAGAGSGKTKALTNRIAFMIREKHISPWSILAVTFTNKAAKEMQRRISGILQKDKINEIENIFGVDILDKIDLPLVGTFHSICVRILRKHIHNLDYENSFVIYDAADQLILMKKIMKRLMLDPKKINPKAVLHHISMAKNQLIGPDEYKTLVSDYFAAKVAEIFPIYQNELKQANACDFDDLIMLTVQLFNEFPAILNAYQEKFRYISVDEYQDTNKAQYVLVNLLAAKYRNLCVIGDIDQSIYSWRGATISNILDFEKDYPEAKLLKLEENYRSTQIILDASNAIIQKNSQRKEKSLWTTRTGGEKIRRWLADNERHEAQLVSEEILSILREYEHRDYSKFTILYRTNAQSRVFEEVFMRYGIPYKIVGGIRFYERKEIKDLIAYLRIIQNPHDAVSLLRIINTPSRKLGAKTLEVMQNFAAKHQISLFNTMLLAAEIPELPPSKKKTFENFVKLIKNLQYLNEQYPASAMIKYALEMTGYKKMLDDGTIEGEARLENIGELVNVAMKYDKLEAGLSLNIFLEEVSLIADIDNFDDNENSATLMTIHSAKGLEFPNVFIVGLEEGVFPHNRSMFDPQELEEERRLMYVAMTRAQDNLYLLHARTRTFYGDLKSNAPSQFIDDIDSELVISNYGQRSVLKPADPSSFGSKPIPVEIEQGLDVKVDVGDKIRHSSFGEGIVINVTGGIATIAFNDRSIGVKKLALSVAPITKI